MKKKIYIIAIMLMVISIFASSKPSLAMPAPAIPTITVISVVPDVSVIVRTANFPKDKTFTVTMGKIGTMGVGGVVVATTESGNGGSFQATYNIPITLKGQALIAIRLQSTTGKYYAYNWFANSNKPLSTSGITFATSGSTTVGGTPISLTPMASSYRGYPYFGITGVVQDTKVTISGANFPLNKTFNVMMGPYGSYGYGGTQVATLSTGSSTVFNAYNWFFNRSTGGATAVTNLTFSIQSIVTDTSVTVLTNNLPANVEYEVFMGLYGTQGINGTSVGTAKSSSGGAYTATFMIPAGLKGQERIAMRMVGKDGSFAYNWFYNISAGTK